MKFIKSITHTLAAIFAICYKQQGLPKSADFGTADRAEEKERDRRFLASL